MPRLSYAVSEAGLAVPVLIGLDGATTSTLLTARLPISSPVLIQGLIDTGASVTAVAPWILRQLGVARTGTGSTHTASGMAEVQLYRVSIGILPSGGASIPSFVLPSVLISELPAALPDADVLIGLNVLLECKFLLDGPSRQFSLEY